MEFAPLAALPSSLVKILREGLRHVLRHPVPGVAACARTLDGRWVLIRRADTGTWALPGGTLEWGETLHDALIRELDEEAGITDVRDIELVGVFSRPDRDVRFHAVTTVVKCTVGASVKPPMNALEIREVRAFHEDELPAELGMAMRDMLDAARAGLAPVFE